MHTQKLGYEFILSKSNDFVFSIFDDKKFVEVYQASDAEKLGIGSNEKIALAMLLGGDYTEGIKGVGIVNAMEILQAFPVSSGVREGLSTFRTWLDGFNPSEELGDLDSTSKLTDKNIRERLFHKKHKSARSRWIAPKDFPAANVLHAYSKPVVDSSPEEFSWNVPDVQKLQDFCSIKMGWEKAETERTLLPVIKEMKNTSKQTRLDGYFMRVEDDIKFADVRSKRLREVWNMKKK